ncbi:recombinase family protein [Cerasibacillus terrae]|uniref:Recombinase family protein n=1 Tax=Cerasibacillus terrae TaxID=2498845 RepID=A0A5C8NV96_9BACI|nr:recombinase family protein [Cerasibacillus terrae]TXL65053.1 recombinase family protein [Cerasibacillus terrae]
MNCVAYVRTANKKNKEANLLKQTEMIKAFIEEKNWQLDSVYTDTGSGINMNKNLHRMIEDAQQEKFDVIVAIDPSRILRNSDLSSVIGKLHEENKVHIITVDKRVDTLLKDDITL